MANTLTALGKFNRPLVLVLVAALLAGGVTWIAYYYLQQREEAIKAEVAAKSRKESVRKVTVVVPNADAPFKTTLNGANFVARDVEEDLIYPDVILADDFAGLEGRQLGRAVLKGRPVRLSDLMVPEVRDVSSILPAGRRAMTIEIDDLNSIAKSLRPHHRVDIFLVSKAPKMSGSGGNTAQSEESLEQAMLYMQDMVVLATGKEFQDVGKSTDGAATDMVRQGDVEGKEKDFDTVTLLVTPAEAARLMVGQKLGNFRIVLRGAKDRETVKLATLRGSDLMPATAKGRDAGIEFIVGGSNDKLISELAVLPSQDPGALAMQAQLQARAKAAANAMQPARASETDRRNPGTLVPGSPANQPIPALRAIK